MSRTLAAGFGAGVLALTAVSAAPAQPAPTTYPADFGAPALRSWMASATQLRPEQVVAVTRTSISALVDSPQDKPGYRRVWVRSEAVDPAVFTTQGLMSWQTLVDVDCAGRRVRQGATTGHRYRNLIGQGVVVQPQDLDWRTPGERTSLGAVWRAVCDPTFQPPLAVAPPAPVLAPRTAARPAPRPAAPAPRSGPTVQLGSLASQADAERLIGEVRARHAGLLAGRSTAIRPAKVGERLWFRVQVRGFRDAADAAGFCRRVLAGGQECVLLPAAAPRAVTAARPGQLG